MRGFRWGVERGESESEESSGRSKGCPHDRRGLLEDESQAQGETRESGRESILVKRRTKDKKENGKWKSAAGRSKGGEVPHRAEYPRL